MFMYISICMCCERHNLAPTTIAGGCKETRCFLVLHMSWGKMWKMWKMWRMNISLAKKRSSARLRRTGGMKNPAQPQWQVEKRSHGDTFSGWSCKNVETADISSANHITNYQTSRTIHIDKYLPQWLHLDLDDCICRKGSDKPFTPTLNLKAGGQLFIYMARG